MTAPSIVSFAWEAGHTKQVLYVSGEQVHELYATRDGWRHANVSEDAHATISVSDPDHQLIGFAWEAGRSKQVFYGDYHNHVHELFVSAGDSHWQHADLTDQLPLYLEYLGTGYAWEEDRSKHLVFPEQGIIGEALVKPDVRWSTNNLTADVPVKIPPRTYPGLGSFTSGASFAGYGWVTGHSQQVAYVGTDGHIHELTEKRAPRMWEHADLTVDAGAPLPSSTRLNSFIAGYAWEEGHSKQVLYFDDSGAIHELYRGLEGPWRWVNLTDRTGAPRVSSSQYKRMVGYAWPEGRTKQVVFIGDDRHVHELNCGVDGDWAPVADLTVISGGAPLAHPTDNLIAACAWREGGTKQVVYADAQRHIIELNVGLDGVWRFADLTVVTSSPSIG